MAPPRYGSSPEPSTMRPHRGSRATSTIGAKVQCMPLADASVAATRAERSAAAGFQLAAPGSGTGKGGGVRGAGGGAKGGGWARALPPPAQPRELAGAAGAAHVKNRADLTAADLV